MCVGRTLASSMCAPRSLMNYFNFELQNPARDRSLRVIYPFRMPLQLTRIEVDLARIPRRITFRLVIEVRRLRVTGLTAGGDSAGPHGIAELDDCNEAVAARAIALLCAGIRARPE